MDKQWYFIGGMIILGLLLFNQNSIISIGQQSILDGVLPQANQNEKIIILWIAGIIGAVLLIQSFYWNKKG